MVTAFVLIMSKTGKEKDVVKELSRLENVKEVSVVYGDYDIVAKVEVPSMENLNSLIISQIRKIPNVSMTSTLVGI